MATAVPTTELAAVNDMLTAIGTTPVNTLNVSGLTDAAIALDTLRSISKEVQTKGWWFNQDYNVSYAASNSEIVVPSTVLTIRPTFGNYGADPELIPFVQRNNKLWNQTSNSTNFVSTVRADITKEIEFESCPESASRYITIRAARVFQTKVLGDEQQGVYTETHEQEAWLIIEGDDAVSNPQTSLFMRRARLTGGSFRPDPIRSQQPQQRQR